MIVRAWSQVIIPEFCVFCASLWGEGQEPLKAVSAVRFPAIVLIYIVGHKKTGSLRSPVPNVGIGAAGEHMMILRVPNCRALETELHPFSRRSDPMSFLLRTLPA